MSPIEKKCIRKITGTDHNINSEKQSAYFRATRALINIFAARESKQDFLNNMVDIIHRETRCDCVGIRILDEAGKIPYESYVGFSREFWEAENMLSLSKDECVCTRVVKGQTLACDMPVITNSGTFCCGDVAAFVGALSGEESKLYRGICVKCGFSSVAVIPICYRGDTLGAVHMADPKPDRFSCDIIEFVESIVQLIGEALSRHMLEQKLQSSQADLLAEFEMRRQAEYYIEQNQQEFQSILDNIPDIVSRHDKDLRLIYINAAITKVTGLPPEYYIGKLRSEFESKKDFHMVWDEIMRRVFATGIGTVYEFEWDYGFGTRYFQARFAPEFDHNRKVKSVLIVNRDMTDGVLIRKEKEKWLQAENKLFNSGPVVAYKRHPGVDGQMEYISPNISQFGYVQQDLISGKLKYQALIHPEDLVRWQAAVLKHEKENCPYAEIEYRIRRSDGEYRWIHVYKMLLRDAAGAVSGTQGYMLDITERKRVESALWQSEKKYHELVEAANVIIMHLDEQGQILFVNEFGLQFFGFQLMELLNHSLKETILPHYEATGRNLWDIFDDMFGNSAAYEHCILENVKKNGQRVWIEWTNRFTQNTTDNRVRLITVGVDITARRRVEAVLQRKHERYRRNKLLGDMLENRISEADFLKVAKKEGLNLDIPVVCYVVIVNFEDDLLKYQREDREVLQAWLETAVELISTRCGGVLWQGEQEIAVWQYVSNQTAHTLSSWVDKLSETMQDFLRGAHYVIGVSDVRRELKTTYQQAYKAAIIGPVFHSEKNIFYWRELGMSKLLFEKVNSSVGNAFIAEWVGPLVEIPSAKNMELLWTLQELISGDPVTQIANRLHLHPKTVVFRKRRIEQILQKKLDDAETRLNIAVALKLRQLGEKIENLKC